MNNLIKINLLPYREEMNKRKQQQFKTLMYGAVLTGVAAVAATYLFIDNMINNQSERNTLLELHRTLGYRAVGNTKAQTGKRCLPD